MMSKPFVRTALHSLLDMAYPDLCLLCEEPLNDQENRVCHNCLYLLPRVHFNSFTDNESALLFYDKLPFVKATSMFRYVKESSIQSLIEMMKYKGKKEVGQVLGAFGGMQLQQNGFFNDIDVLVPVPLHPRKQHKRGYNQSEWFAKGLSGLTGLPVDTTSLIRTKDNKTQTRKHLFERWENVSTVFYLKRPTAFEHKHILLVDDVLTSGSTLEACGHAVLKAPGCRVSFLTLAKA